MASRAKKPASERAVFLGDVHVPFHDPAAVELALQFLGWFKPDTVFLIGDFLDFVSISRYDKDPQRLLSLQDDLNKGKVLLKRIRKICPKARIVFMQGNHCHRLISYLNQHPEISVLDSLKLPELLDLAALNMEHRGYFEPVKWHGLHVEHGDVSRSKSAYTAAAMLEKRGVCGLSGHTHRLGLYYRTDEAGVKVWAENGCLASLKTHYIIGTPNWMHGFTIGFGLEGNHRFSLEQCVILGNKLYFHGLMWEV